MRYRVRHVTTCAYSTPVLVSHHAARLIPRETERQRCLDASLSVEPAPAARADRVDYFGNPVSFLTIQTSHRVLTVIAESHVEVAPPPAADPLATPPWEAVRAALACPADAPALEAAEFLCDSPFAAASDDLRAYARPSFAPGRPVLDAAFDLTRRIHADFQYDPAATTVSTPLAQVLAMRRGVCQDFAHLQIACLRAMGLAARYVGGYLLTRPPPGQAKLVGADASHAWVSVWIPGRGWVDLDPTNDMLVGDEHVTCAWGRDYEDVSPVKGQVVGGGEHALTVSVDVRVDEG
ncbi:transglutaminase family protein [Azospirillum sp.]|uniref:transglutaminase family protein n=1 Tax=Azospirillum sp. TaxID=34012 RepID=UPI002D2E0191|nr:transglutaminase family protein [Azospirillum sp.]HYD68105.1 transglutaminase family protein [Azospirillum sp.]